MKVRGHMPTGTCKLCLKSEELQNSHLIPSGAYRLIRSPQNKGNPDPLMLTTKRVKRTSKQVQRHPGPSFRSCKTTESSCMIDRD